MQKAIRSTKDPIQAKITLPGSKSITIRALLLAALADGVSEISDIHLSKNTKMLINAIHELGIVTQFDEKTRSCIIAGGSGKFPKKQATIWCEQSKTIARLLMAACSSTPGVYYFDGSPSLRKKNMAPFLSILLRQGIQLIPNDAKKMPFTLIGADTLDGGEVTLENHQAPFISALLLMSPFSRSPFTLSLLPAQQHAYLDMTSAMMAEFGVLVHRLHQGQFMIPVPQRYQARDYFIEPDFSIATYFFAAAAITGGRLTIQACKLSLSKQPDAKFPSLLEKMGCRMIETHQGLTLEALTELHGIEVSLTHFSDTFLALAVTAIFATSPTTITHIGKPTKKERHRMTAIKTEFAKMDINVEILENSIKIYPNTPKACMLNSHHDYRLAMAFSVIGLKIPGIIIDDINPILSAYPEFINLWESLTEYTNISM